MSELFNEVLASSELANASSSDCTDEAVELLDTLVHSGILGQKWGRRRYQNPDGSLTEAGRIRYSKKGGGAKMIKDREKERARRQKILKDPKKLAKHKDEFTKEEIDKAMQTFESQNRLKNMIESEKQAARKAKEDRRKAKYEYKKAKLNQRIDEAKAVESLKQQKLQTEQKRAENEAKKDDRGKSAADKWQNRANKYDSILKFAKTGKTILQDLGLADEGGESLFANLGVMLGMRQPASEKPENQRKKKWKKEEEAWAHASKYYDMLSKKNKAEGKSEKGQSNRDVNDILEDIDIDDLMAILNAEGKLK